jgi:hypothetical protein
MKKYIAIIALITGIANAETITLDTPIQVGGTISAIEVGGVQYNANDNSWSINASPVVSYPEPQESNGVYASVLISVNLSITVQRAEIEAALGIASIDDATVKQLNDTVRAIAMSKALAALQPE